MGFDLVAPVYQFLEYTAFGSRLQRRRTHYLERVKSSQFALVLGDGDGRFLEELLAVNAAVQVDSVDMSRRMTAIARERIERRFGSAGVKRVRCIEGDARLTHFPRTSYDLIATHFFLDCFTDGELATLVERIAKVAAPGACWIVSEFRQPQAGMAAIHARLWLWAMYTFFRVTAGLKTRQLPDHRSTLSGNGFRLIAENASRFQLIGSELWRKTE